MNGGGAKTLVTNGTMGCDGDTTPGGGGTDTPKARFQPIVPEDGSTAGSKKNNDGFLVNKYELGTLVDRRFSILFRPP
uniref:Uncharacterized protein n=1 Tax=Romanomermis culicivorax TaxID=13658 RepID=A0A915IKN5_ROMCU